MKSLVVILSCVMLVSSSCSKSEENTPDMPPSSTDTFNPTTATLVAQGTFSGNRNYTVSGVAKRFTFQGKDYIYLENFSTTNGPDLKVYLATTTTANQFVSLGVLKGASGNQSYVVSVPVDFKQYDKVLIWCQQFSALFGAATLQ
jgi:hypothetical protein